MRLPWFMHMHAGQNSLTGVLPTPIGTFVRSNANGRMEATWYPMDTSFAGGATREAKRLVVCDSTDEGERELENAVLAFMHADPTLALHKAFDGPAGEALTWNVVGGGALATLENEHGVFIRIHHANRVTVEFLPSGGTGQRETVGVLADSCDDATLAARIDALARRRTAKAAARHAA